MTFYRGLSKLLLFLLSTAAMGTICRGASPYDISPVVLQGQEAPDGLGAFQSFGSFDFNDLGEIAFLAQATTAGRNTSGLFIHSGGQIRSIALQGRVAPGAGERLFGDLSEASIDLNNAGQIAFSATLNAPRSDGLFLYSQELVSPLVFSGDPLDGAEFLMQPSTHVVRINDRGEIAFQNAGKIYRYSGKQWTATPAASREEGPPPLNVSYQLISLSNDGTALLTLDRTCSGNGRECSGQGPFEAYLLASDRLTRIPLEDAAAAGRFHTSPALRVSRRSEAGCLAFDVSLAVSDQPTATRGSFLWCPGKAGSAILASPYCGAGDCLPGAILCCRDRLSLNDSGAVVVHAGVTQESAPATVEESSLGAILVRIGDKLERILLSGISLYPQIDTVDLAYGTGGAHFLSVSNPTLNKGGDIAFAAALFGGSIGSESGIFVARASQ